MIGVVSRTIFGPSEFVSLGPLWAGLVLRGLWLCMNLGANGVVRVLPTVSGGPVRDLEALLAGRSLVQGSETVGQFGAGPYLEFTVGASGAQERTVPFYFPVQAGSVFVGVGLSASQIGVVMCGLVVEADPVVRGEFVPRGLAVGGLRSNSRVLAELREEAVGSRA